MCTCHEDQSVRITVVVNYKKQLLTCEELFFFLRFKNFKILAFGNVDLFACILDIFDADAGVAKFEGATLFFGVANLMDSSLAVVACF